VSSNERRKSMSERSNVALLDLDVVERGQGVGSALPAFPLCCSLVLCRGCSCSCSSGEKIERA
jgi:hypothetical protein